MWPLLWAACSCWLRRVGWYGFCLRLCTPGPRLYPLPWMRRRLGRAPKTRMRWAWCWCWCAKKFRFCGGAHGRNYSDRIWRKPGKRKCVSPPLWAIARSQPGGAWSGRSCYRAWPGHCWRSGLIACRWWTWPGSSGRARRPRWRCWHGSGCKMRTLLLARKAWPLCCAFCCALCWWPVWLLSCIAWTCAGGRRRAGRAARGPSRNQSIRWAA